MDDGQANDKDFGCRRNALALRLQQRRSRKVLAEQGIIPPLKSPGTFFEQVQRLERAHKEKFLNKAIQIRPVRDELVQKHILEDTSASNAIVAHQKDLKKAQLVDDLNDKIALRPGVIELVERNIIQANEPLHEALKGGHIQYKKISDLVDEDSGEALSPEQVPPPPTCSPPLVLHIATTLPTPITTIADRTIKTEEKCLMKSPSSSSLYSQTTSHPYLSRQLSKGTKMGQNSSMSRMTTSRKKKEKPKFKKFKYHQYVPPDQQQGKTTRLLNPNETDDDTPYTRLLQQQQLYLQHLIMNKQYNQRSGDSSQQTGSFSQKGLNPPPPPPASQGIKMEKPRSNVALTLGRIEEMKVSELKEELKFRRLKVTGTKEVLVERLKPFCVDSENPFLTDLQDENSSSMVYATAGSPTTINDVSFSGVSQDSNHSMQPIISQGMAMSPPNHDQVGSNDPGPSTAYSIDPNTVFHHRVARMPVPEQHKIILKQEKFTMPTWHSNIQDARVVSISSHGTTSSSFTYPESHDVNKDQLLEKQQKEINDLRRMVELHRSQLMKLQEHNPGETKHDPQQQVFEFPQTRISNHRTQPAVQFCSSNPSTVRQTSQQFNSPPNYDQAYEMLNDLDSRGNPQQENVSRQMDDLLELLADHGELPVTPVVTRQRLNDHPSYQGLSDPTMRHHPGYPQQHRLPSNEYGSVIAQERAQLQQEIAQQQSYSHRVSRDFASPDVAKMLVETAGDALMDTSSFPPVITSSLNDRCVDQPLNYSRASARNSVDSGIIYSNSHYSPMDTNMDGSSKDLFNDLRLSSSSLDSGEPTLNTVSLSPATPPRPKPYLQSTFRPHPSPRSSHTHLVKSASQELLSSSDNSTSGNHTMGNKLGWLDLTLGSAVGGPPSPGGPFGYMNSDESHLQNTRYHPGVGYNSFHENENILGVSGSTGTLNMNPGLGGTGVEQWDPWDGLLESNFNT